MVPNEGSGKTSERCPMLVELFDDDDEACDVEEMSGSGTRVIVDGDEDVSLFVCICPPFVVVKLVEPLTGAKPTDGGFARYTE